MTEYRIFSIMIQNFCGIKSLEISPNGSDLTIFGDNATGKTTVANAFSWLFTGKNASGTADLDPAPLDQDNSKIHNLETSVSVEFTDGTDYRRVLTEVWSKKRECVTRERARQIHAKSFRKLRHPGRLNYLKYGVSGVIARQTESAREAALASLSKLDIKPEDITLEELELSVRSYNCLKRAGMNTLRDVAEMTFDELCYVRNLGKKSVDEICAVLTKYGIKLNDKKG